MSEPANVTLFVKRGDTLRKTIEIKDASSGEMVPSPEWTARMQVRASAGDTGEPLLELVTGALTDNGSGLSFDAEGVLEVLINEDDLSDLPEPDLAPSDVAFSYDIKMREAGGDIETDVEGALIVSTPVTTEPPPEA